MHDTKKNKTPPGTKFSAPGHFFKTFVPSGTVLNKNLYQNKIFVIGPPRSVSRTTIYGNYCCHMWSPGPGMATIDCPLITNG